MPLNKASGAAQREPAAPNPSRVSGGMQGRRGNEGDESLVFRHATIRGRQN